MQGLRAVGRVVEVGTPRAVHLIRVRVRVRARVRVRFRVRVRARVRVRVRARVRVRFRVRVGLGPAPSTSVPTARRDESGGRCTERTTPAVRGSKSYSCAPSSTACSTT